MDHEVLIGDLFRQQVQGWKNMSQNGSFRQVGVKIKIFETTT